MGQYMPVYHTTLLFVSGFHTGADSSEPSAFLCDLVDLNNTFVSTVLNFMLSHLHKYGFTWKYLKQNLISFTADGASNMLGRKKGVTAMLVELFPDVLNWHCCKHWLELATNDVAQEIN
jgi:hypothetical protein